MASPSYLQVLSLGFVLIVLCMHHCSARKVLMDEDMMNKQEKSQPKDEVKVKPAPMAHETDHGPAQKQEKSQPKDEAKVNPASMTHENDHGLAQKQEKSRPKDQAKVNPAPMTNETDHGLASQKNNNDTMASKEGEIGLECGGGGCDSPCYELPCNGGDVVVISPPIVIYPPPVPYIIVKPPCQPCEPWTGPGPCPCPCEEEGYSDTQAIKTEGGGHDGESNNKVRKEGEMQGGSSLLSGKEETQISIGKPATGNAANAPMPAIIHASNLHA